jgi:hypothetical protein
MQPTNEQLLWMYETMLVIREFEETMVNVYLEGKLPPRIQKGLAFDIGAGPVPGEMHLAAGQEPVAVGVCAHLHIPLKAGVKRLGVPNVPIPYSRPLEQAVIPQVGHISQALRGLVVR